MRDQQFSLAIPSRAQVNKAFKILRKALFGSVDHGENLQLKRNVFAGVTKKESVSNYNVRGFLFYFQLCSWTKLTWRYSRQVVTFQSYPLKSSRV